MKRGKQRTERYNPMGNTTTHPVDHLQQLLHTTPLNTTRPKPYHTLQQLARAERLTPARKTIVQRARTQHSYSHPIPNRYHQHFQHSFDPDGTTVPRTGTSIPSTHGTSHPANTPFARGLRKAQRFVRAGWLHDDPNACCVPLS
jgi:hypothetical protein